MPIEGLTRRAGEERYTGTVLAFPRTLGVHGDAPAALSALARSLPGEHHSWHIIVGIFQMWAVIPRAGRCSNEEAAGDGSRDLDHAHCIEIWTDIRLVGSGSSA
jgi:hypothetical protein